ARRTAGGRTRRGDARPAEGARAEQPPGDPETEIAEVDAERARGDAAPGGQRSLLDQQPSRDRRDVFRNERAEHDGDQLQGHDDVTGKYRMTSDVPRTSRTVRLTVAASGRSIRTLISGRSRH